MGDPTGGGFGIGQTWGWRRIWYGVNLRVEEDLVWGEPGGGRFAKRSRDEPQKSDDILRELTDLRAQMKQAIAEAHQRRDEAIPEGAPRAVTPVLDQTISMYEGPAPLDQYLNKVVPPPTSPYPKLKEPGLHGNAPIISHYSDAQDVLKKVTQSRTYLEANLESILRNRQESDVYALLDNIGTDGLHTERQRIQKMVDKHITAMNTNMEREVLDELLKVEEAKQHTANFMIPERDTTAPTDKSKVKVTGPRARFKAESRIDSGLNKKREGLRSDGVKLGEKENLPQKKIKKSKGYGVKPLDSEEAMNRIYGKTANRAQRKTQKEPYLRFRSTSPVMSSAKPVGHPTSAKGVLMSGVRTQAGDGYIPSPPTQHVPPTQPQMPPPPALIPMAIPLGAPRKDGGLTSAVSFPSQPATSTPYGSVPPPPPNVGVLNMRDQHMVEEDEMLKARAERKKEVKLEKRTLPSIDIDSFQTPPLSPKSNVATSKDLEKKPNVDFQKIEAEELQQMPEVVEQTESEDDEDSHTMTEDPDSAAIDLPGYQAPPTTAYHGPKFPPQAPSYSQAPPTSDVLANDIRRRDLLQNQALDWVEQELMARVLSDVYAKRQETLPHTPASKRSASLPQQEEDDTESLISEVSSHESFIAETLGHEGFQLFVDAGQPVDDKLVNALLKDVILEKISSLVGQRTSLNEAENRPVSVAMEIKQPSSTTTRQHEVHRIDSPVQIPTTPVVTPQVTPRHTPPPAPSLHQGTPPITPDRSLSPSISEPPVTKVTIPALEREDSIKDESEETRFRRIIDALPITPLNRVGESPGPPHLEVGTPDATPPPSPPPGPAILRTPSPSLHTLTPDVTEEQAPSPVVPSPVHPVSEPVEPESPPQEHSVTEHSDEPEPELPAMCTVAVQADAESPRPPSPKLQTRRLSASSEESPITSDTISDTINQNISEGQWLVSLHSEGEVTGLQADQGYRERIKQLLSRPSKGRDLDESRADDTLMDTDDLEPDQVNLHHSEGEFHHAASVFNERSAAISLLAQMKPTPIFSAPRPIQATELAMGVDTSLGEVSFGQRPRLSAAQERAVLGERRSNGNNGRFVHRDEQESLGEISEGPEDDLEQPGLRTQDNLVQPGVRTISVEPRPSTAADSPLSKSLTRPITVTPGGREPSRDTRMGSGPGVRPRVIQVGRSLSPEPAPSRIAGKKPETALSQTSLLGTSELETHTTDQMNMEALLRSGDYFGNTQSDFGSTAGDMNYRLSYSMNRSEEFQTGLSRQSIGSTSDMSLAPGLTKTLERSEEELAQDSRLSYSADSDLRASGQLGTGGHLGGSGGQYSSPGAQRTGPLQVSVKMPSMGDEDSVESYDDVSELSMV